MSFFNIKKIFGGLGSVVGVDMGSSSIKVVELKTESGNAVLKSYGEIALGPYVGESIGMVPNITNSKVSEALKDVMKEAGILTKDSGVSIPFKNSLVTLIELPALSQKKLDEIIPIEARKYIPVPISEVTLDWWLIPKENIPNVNEGIQKKVDMIDVLVVSIHNDVLNNYNSIIRENALETSFFEIEMFGSTRSLVSKNNNPILIFDMGALGTKLYIADRGVIKMSHIINRGSKDITISISKALSVDFGYAEKVKRNVALLNSDDQKVIWDVINLSLDYIWSETRAFIETFQTRFGKKISQVLLTGGGVSLPGFKDKSQEALSIPTEYGNPFGKISTPAFLSSALKDTAHEFAVATGIALRKLEEQS